MKVCNGVKFIFPAISENERTARAVVSAFLVQLDPTVEELADIRTAVSEAVTNAIVHGYRQKSGDIELHIKLLENREIYLRIKDRGCGIADVEQAMQPLFTTAPEIIEQGCAYLGLLKWTFVLFMVSNLLICALRSVEIVKISFAISVVSLITNGIINYTLIFGHFGFPEMGVRGAAVGTLTSRILELLIVVWYLVKKDEKLRLFDGGIRGILPDRETVWHYACVAAPILLSSVVWSISVPMQTAILGHLSADAIAANSVATTFFQYLKVIVIALSSSSAVIIGKSIGVGNEERIRSDARTLSVIDVTTGAVLGLLLFLLRHPLLSMYNLSDEAMVLADHLIIIMSCVMVGMSYQMPVSSGIIQSSGDTKFSMCVNLVSIWCIVMPLSFCAAFVWKLPVEMVVLAVQSDQFFKGIPVFLRFRSYKWIHRLTK